MLGVELVAVHMFGYEIAQGHRHAIYASQYQRIGEPI